jgi:2-phosphosulfolactate phosphatase
MGSMPAWAGQENYDVRFQWGPFAAQPLAGGTCVVVDVLRFTTAAEAATARGAAVYPYRWHDDTAAAFADSVGARLASHRDPAGPSLSPLSMHNLSPSRRWCSRHPTDRPAPCWRPPRALG